MKWMEEQLSLEDLGLSYGRMFAEPPVQTIQKTSDALSNNSAGSKTKPFAFLDLRKGSGLMRDASWEMVSVLRGESETPSTGELPKDGVASLFLWTTGGWTQQRSCLSNILQEDAPTKYDLSEKACKGILNRAAKRGKALPDELRQALEGHIGL